MKELHAGAVERFLEELHDATLRSWPPSATYWLQECAEIIVALDAENKTVLTDLAYQITQNTALVRHLQQCPQCHDVVIKKAGADA